MADIAKTHGHVAATDAAAHGSEHHSTARAHQFDTAEQQFAASQLGIWTFLATEVLTFGGLFLAYIVYRTLYNNVFLEASTHQNVALGALNTLVLIASSCTMALGVWASQTGKRKLLMWMLAGTIFFAGIFMVNKAFEYYQHWDENLVPGASFHFEREHAEGTAGAGESHAAAGTGESHTAGETTQRGDRELTASNVAPGSEQDFQGKAQLFFLLYFIMTGLHGFHVLVGMVLLGWLLWRAWRREFSPEYYTPVEVTGLYWHFVDLVWIFLFPLLYLIGGFSGFF